MEKSNLDIIRALLGLEVKKNFKFASATLIDGTKVETSEGQELVEGSTLYVVNEDGSKSLAPVGVHQTETAQIEVGNDGMIVSITEKEALEEETITEEKPIAEEVIIEIVEKVIEEKMGKVKETIELFISELEAVKSEMGKMKNKYEAFTKQPAAEPVKSIFTEEKTDIADRRLNFLKNHKKELFN